MLSPTRATWVVFTGSCREPDSDQEESSAWMLGRPGWEGTARGLIGLGKQQVGAGKATGEGGTAGDRRQSGQLARTLSRG